MEKLIELRAKKTELLETAKTHLEKNEVDKANKVMAQIEELNKNIAAHEKLRDEMAGTTEPILEPEANIKENATPVGIKSSKEYKSAFFTALSNSESVKTAKGKEKYDILFDAMTEGVPSDGGFLVPEDVEHKINELKRDFTDLSQFVTIELVTAITGRRVKEKAPNSAKFVKVSELGQIPNIDDPQFETISYEVKKYAGILPVSNELLEDNIAGLSAYIARWFARMGTNTDNDNILTLLNTLTATVYDVTKGVDPLKSTLNVKLDPALSVNAVILTNQSGMDILDQMKDNTGRSLLQPDPTNATVYRVLGRRVIAVSDAIMKNGTGTGKPAPMYVGDLKQFATLFRRSGLEMASTNVGAGTFETDSTKFRGIMRADYQTFEKEAVVKLSLPTTA